MNGLIEWYIQDYYKKDLLHIDVFRINAYLGTTQRNIDQPMRWSVIHFIIRDFRANLYDHDVFIKTILQWRHLKVALGAFDAMQIPHKISNLHVIPYIS